jgi:glycosyltransferase involved in cell wall biosynthesis
VEEFSPGIPTLLSAYKERPVVLQIQGYTGKKYFEKYNPFFSFVLYTFERFLPLFYQNYILVSEESRKRYGLGASGSNIGIISNGISEELFGLEPGESDYILYLGRLDIHHKGLDLLLTAYEKFSDRFPGVRLYVAGDGKDRQDFLSRVKNLPSSVRRNIEMKGWVEGERKNLLLRDALLVVIPSRYETQGIVALEAMASGKAIVASDIPELGYIRDSGAGLSFRSGDAHALASAMEKLISGDNRMIMGEKGRKWVRRFTWREMARMYEEFLLGVLNNWKRPGKKNRD